MKSVFYFLTSIIAVSSCSDRPAKVIVDKIFPTYNIDSPHRIIFDNKDTFNLSATVLTVMLNPGKHSFVLDKDLVKEFTVTDSGGILNLDNREYVAFNIEYTPQTGDSRLNIASMSLKSQMLIDSMVIIPNFSLIITKEGILNNSDSILRKILPDLIKAKNGNYFLGEKDYDTNETIAGIKKFGKDKLFINKFWSYNLGENIPEIINEYVNKNDFWRTSRIRSAVIHAEEFLLFAHLSPDQYSVVSIKEIMEGKENLLNKKETQAIDSTKVGL